MWNRHREQAVKLVTHTALLAEAACRSIEPHTHSQWLHGPESTWFGDYGAQRLRCVVWDAVLFVRAEWSRNTTLMRLTPSSELKQERCVNRFSFSSVWAVSQDRAHLPACLPDNTKSMCSPGDQNKILNLKILLEHHMYSAETFHHQISHCSFIWGTRTLMELISGAFMAVSHVSVCLWTLTPCSQLCDTCWAATPWIIFICNQSDGFNSCLDEVDNLQMQAGRNETRVDFSNQCTSLSPT